MTITPGTPAHRVAHAYTLHKNGDLINAENAYRQVLAEDPSQPDALHLLGLILFETGRVEEARDSVEHAVRHKTDISIYYNNLSLIHLALSDTNAARAAAQNAIRLAPGDATAHVTLGTVHHRDRNIAEADNCFRRALALDSGHVPARTNLATLYLETGALDDAEREFTAALRHDPGYIDAVIGLAKVLQRKGRPEDAATVLQPHAEKSPSHPDTILMHAESLLLAGRTQDALSRVTNALKDLPHSTSIRNFSGHLLRELGRPREAMTEFERILAQNPNHVDARINLGLTQLGLGNFTGGWKNYRTRAAQPGISRPGATVDIPLWQGEDLSDKHLIAWTEQGLGDEILQASLIADLLDRVDDLTVLCSERLTGVLGRSFPSVRFIAKSDDQPLGKADLTCPLLDTALVLRPDHASFPNHTGYLKPDPVRVADLRRKYCLLTTSPDPSPLIIGLSWRSGNAVYGSVNTFELSEWGPVFDAAKTGGREIIFIASQYDVSERDIAAARAQGAEIHADSDIDLRGPLDEAVAQLAACDLVISTSTTTVQLAGALGRPTFHMPGTGLACGWYWTTGDDRTPWYPSLLQFRRENEQGRAAQMISVAEALAQFIGGGEPQSRP